MKVAIIGAGAAGCFCAVNLKRMAPQIDVVVFESASKPLAKVAITGGGRCNLTNTFALVDTLQQVYPRGDRLMRRALAGFSNDDTCQWFEDEGVKLVTQDDECIFPASQNAMEIVDTLTRLMRQLGVRLQLSSRIVGVSHNDSSYTLTVQRRRGLDVELTKQQFDKVVVTTGGHPKVSGFDMLDTLNLPIQSPVPSLFTFNIDAPWLQQLMGTVVEEASVALAGTKFKAMGALLLTHWGMSGPAILRLSSYAARHLADNDYRATIIVNWCGEQKEDEIRQVLLVLSTSNANKLVTNVYPDFLTQKHWIQLLQRANVPLTQRWGALNKKHINKLTTVLTADTYAITGKCAFKEEFVTCGGVALSCVNMQTMECKTHPGLYLAGEVLDVDAVTGGFNLQAAWSMAMVVARHLAASVSKL